MRAFRAAGMAAAFTVQVFLAAGTAGAAPAPAQIEDGQLAGVAEDGMRRWLGIPYAAPPTGQNRWTEPMQAEPWQGLRAADRFGPACAQVVPGNTPATEAAPVRTSEDCLTLNVWSPEGATGLPVLVWIHGGGFVAGNAVSPVHDGSALARRGAIVVTLHYRLGALGFFAHPDLGGGNFALMDQIAALRWVHRNIAAFGGDPARVTLFGNSSGANTVLHLLAAPTARGLFSGAIAESAVGFSALPERAQMEKVGTDIAERARAEGFADPRMAPVEKILEWAGAATGPGAPAGRYFAPFRDGVTVRESAERAFFNGLTARVPLLIGSNDYEASLLEASPGAGSNLRRVLGPELSRGAGDATLFTDARFGAHARLLARLHSSFGAPAWLYRFEHAAPNRPGAPHGWEVPFVFDRLDAVSPPPSWTTSDRAVAAALADRWVAFAARGIPDPENVISWPRWQPKQERMLYVRSGLEIGQAARPDRLTQIALRLFAATN